MSEQLDPYRPPTADVSSSHEENYVSARLYKIGHIGMATFFGSVAAGFLLMALNDRAFGRPAESRKTIITGIIVTILVLVAAYFIPESVPAIPINLAIVFGVMKYAEYKQGDLLFEYMENGADHHSGWRAFGISIICVLVVMLIVAAAVFAAVLMYPESFPY